MNTLTPQRHDDSEVISVLQNSLYPGAKPDSIRLVLSYCRVNGLDPMLKPVHIVPTNVKVKGEDGRDRWEWRDVLMPGIADYRIKASRTGEYGGISEPQFGPMVDDELDGVRVRYPEWCSVTVYRWVKNEFRAFPAKEYWVENYATAGKDTEKPNRMWQKRPCGQIAKCSEAQALRKAFPEFSGGSPTAEEMEGKEFEGLIIEHKSAPARTRPVQAIARDNAPKMTLQADKGVPVEAQVSRAMGIIDHGQPRETAAAIGDGIPVLSDAEQLAQRVERAMAALGNVADKGGYAKVQRSCGELLRDLDAGEQQELKQRLVAAMMQTKDRVDPPAYAAPPAATPDDDDPFGLPPLQEGSK